jgi:glycosyltransferase involved in cell wall biosynthesis
MPLITALLHTANDGQRLGRALEMLLPCAEILIVDHHSTDATVRVAREYGARVVEARGQAPANHYLEEALHDWILCLLPSESITEGLQATLFEWSSLPDAAVAEPSGFSVVVREQVGKDWMDRDWRELPEPEIRLIPRNWTLWHGNLPAHHPSSRALEGELLRIAFP